MKHINIKLKWFMNQINLKLFNQKKNKNLKHINLKLLNQKKTNKILKYYGLH